MFLFFHFLKARGELFKKNCSFSKELSTIKNAFEILQPLVLFPLVIASLDDNALILSCNIYGYDRISIGICIHNKQKVKYCFDFKDDM